MLASLKLFLMAILSIDIVICETEVNNSTVISRREFMEQQARTAYQNACYRLQELSNWMTAVFRIKSVWASATVNEISMRSEKSLSETDPKRKSALPQRHKTTGSECSLGSVQVTAQTYAYLQSQLVMMKWLMGRNIFKSGKERFEGANTSLRERMKMLETINATVNDVVFKLKKNTVNTSTSVDSEAFSGRSTKDPQEGRFFQLLQTPKTVLMGILDGQVMNNQTRDQSERKSFFQNLGRNLDKLIFPGLPFKLNTNAQHSVSTADVSTVNPQTADVSSSTVSSRTDASPFKAPAADAPQFNAPSADASPFDAPSADASPFDAPSADASPFDAPSADASQFDAPSADASQFDAPAADASPFNAPVADASMGNKRKTNAIMFSSIL